MKFLICGIGSIGQRHYKNLRELGHEVAVCRSGRGGYNEEFIKKFFIDEEDQGRPVKVYTDISTALNIWDPTAVFICTPNFAHIDLALIAAQYKKHLFIEKPVSNTLYGLNPLGSLCREHNLVTMVGYNLRFDAALSALRDYHLIKPSTLHADVVVTENIADWHTWENYWDSYGCWKDKGGGVVLCYSHEIDLIYWLFGKPEKVYAVGGKVTPLKGDAEDMVDVLFQFPNNVAVSLHMDYWQRPAWRKFALLKHYSPTTWEYCGQVDQREKMFVTGIKEFISAIKEERPSAIPLEQGRDVLEICLEIKKQIEA